MLNLYSLFLSELLYKNSTFRPVPAIFDSFKPVAKDTPSNVPKEAPAVKVPV